MSRVHYKFKNDLQERSMLIESRRISTANLKSKILSAIGGINEGSELVLKHPQTKIAFDDLDLIEAYSTVEVARVPIPGYVRKGPKRALGVDDQRVGAASKRASVTRKDNVTSADAKVRKSFRHVKLTLFRCVFASL